jgi:hypothetical protein
MTLGLYYRNTSGSYVAVSTAPDLSSPITTTHDGKNGDVKTVLLYIRNDNAALWYSNIRIRPIDTLEAYPYGDVIFTETGWGIKLSSGGTAPTASEWDDILWGNELSMDNIGTNSLGNTTTYYPFYYYIVSPPNIPAANKTDIQLDVRYTENSVS